MTIYLGRIPYFADQVRAVPNYHTLACLADFAANGSCMRPVGHDGPHQDANGYAWIDSRNY